MDTVLHAVVLAGRRNEGALSGEGGAYEALVEIAGQPMVALVVRALLASQAIGQVVVVGPRQIGFEDPRLSCIDPGADMLHNLRLGAAALPQEGRLLAVTSDIPLLTPAAVDAFLSAAAAEPEADVVYPVIPQEAIRQRFTGMKRTYVRLKDVTVTGGNMMLLSRSLVDAIEEVGQRLVQMRKSPLRLALLLGPLFVARLLLHRVSLAEAVERASAMFGLKGAALVMPWPEIGVDVDKPSDLMLCRTALTSRAAAL